MAFGNDQKALEEVVVNYMAHMDEALRVEKNLYEERLRMCEVCEEMINGMCKFCGCFCVIRALKAVQYCPHPNGKRW